MTLEKGIGIKGDYHSGTDRQISMLSAEVREWMDACPVKGLCFRRFCENILLEGELPSDWKSGHLLTSGEVVLRVNKTEKKCYSECALFSSGKPCRLSTGATYAKVEQSGVLKLGDNLASS